MRIGPPSLSLPAFRPLPSIRVARRCLHSTPTRSLQATFRLKPSRFNRAPLPALTSSATAALERRGPMLPLRTGLLATKVGMTAMYDPSGVRIPCTVLAVDRVEVVSHKTRQQHGYYAVQVGMGWRHPSNVPRPMLGHFAKHGVSPKQVVREFRVRDESGLVAIGGNLGAGWFAEGGFVDARANCKGKGFAGGMKRHGFSGQPASHGTSLTHRAMGSAGQSQGGGSRVLPGKKMAGRMGGQQVTTQNVKVLKVDAEKGILVLNGCISGPNGCTVQIQDAIKRPWPENVPTEVEPAKPTKSVGEEGQVAWRRIRRVVWEGTPKEQEDVTLAGAAESAETVPSPTI